LIPAETGNYLISLKNDDSSWVYIDGELFLSHTGTSKREVKSREIRLEKGRAYTLKVEYAHENPPGRASFVLGLKKAKKDLIKDAVSTATGADVVILFTGFSDIIESETSDRSELTLPEKQVEVLEAVSAVNDNIITVLHSGAQVLMTDWLAKTDALLEAWYPGQECGTVITDILFGDVSPSGKLPMTFMNRWEDHSAFGNYPGENGEVHYKEGIYVGYRHFDKNNIEPLYPFGYGLSYTVFEYSDIVLAHSQLQSDDTLTVNVTVKNTGNHAGAEVVQLYIQDLVCSVERPVKELKGFERVVLHPGQSENVVINVDKSALSFFDENEQAWVAEPGYFKAMVGSSSRDIRLSAEFEYRNSNP
jgi:beta-glucosidase